MIQIYTDIIRRNVEQYGAKSRQALEALKDVDDILQAKLTDIKAKNQNADLSVGYTFTFTVKYHLIQFYLSLPSTILIMALSIVFR